MSPISCIPSCAVSEISLDGVTFRLSVEGLPQHFESLFPVLIAGDEVQILLGAGKTVAPELAAVLDEAARQFLHRFRVTSSLLVGSSLDGGAASHVA